MRGNTAPHIINTRIDNGKCAPCRCIRDTDKYSKDRERKNGRYYPLLLMQKCIV